MAKLAVFLFGAPRADVDGAPVRVDTRKAFALLAYLAVTGRPHTREEFAALFWPDYDETRGRRALRRTLSALRTALGGGWLAAGRDEVLLEREDLDIDVTRFHQELVCPSRAHPSNSTCPACRPRLERAVDIATGEFMSGFSLRDAPAFDDWQTLQAEELRRELAGALETLSGDLFAAGDPETGAGYARRWLALDPLHEPAHRALMGLYARTGRRSAAIRQYRKCVRTLDEELGVAPLQETSELYREILNGTLGSEPARRVAGVGPPSAAAPSSDGTLLPFVGRDAEWALAEPAIRRGLTGGHLLLIEGEAGVGKTRLAQELSGAAGKGARIVRARAHAGEEHLPYALVASVLRDLTAAAPRAIDALPDAWREQAARVAPELGRRRRGRRVGEPPADAARGRAFLDGVVEALLALATTERSVLVLDDLEWADAATRQVVAYLTRRIRGRRLALVLIWRTGSVRSEEALLATVAEGEREGWATVVVPSRLGVEDVDRLVRAAWRGPDAASWGRWIHEASEGVPFYVAEYLRDAVNQSPGAGELRLPPAVGDLLRSRLRPLGNATRQVLDAAAILGGSADSHLMQAVSGRSSEEVAVALEELMRLELLRPIEIEPTSFEFGHHTLREFVARELGPVRWRLLNRRTAAAMSRLPGARREALAPVIARHLQAAGEDERAAELFERAGRAARELFANRDAAAHFEAALALGHPDRAGLHEEIGDARTLLGDYSGAFSSYEAAAAACDPGDEPRIERKLGGVLLRRGDFAGADRHFLAALDGLGGADEGAERSRILADRSLAAHRLGREADALGLAEDAVTSARAVGDTEALAQAHNILGILALRGGDTAGARDRLREGVELGATLPEPTARIAALNNLALALAANGDLEGALARAGTALDLCARQGDRHREAAIRNNLADFLHRAGRNEESMDELKRAVAIFAEIGDPLDERQAEIWKLVEW